MRTTTPALASFALLVSTALLGAGCDPAYDGTHDTNDTLFSTGGGGSGGGDTGGQLPAAEQIGSVVELTAPSIDVTGQPSIAANTDRWAVQWIDRDGGYPEGGVTFVGADGATLGVANLDLADRAVVRASEETGSFGALTTTTAPPTYSSAFSFHTIGLGVPLASERLTDYDYDSYSFDVAPLGGQWVMGICNRVVADGRLFRATFGEDVPQSPFSPIDVEQVTSEGGAACDEVRVATTGEAVWAAFSGRMDGEENFSVFLQRIDSPAAIVRVTLPGVDALNPHLLIHGSEMVVEFWFGDSKRRGIRRYDFDGNPLGDSLLLESEQDIGGDCDAAMVGDHVVIGWLGAGAVVQSFALDGTAVTSPLTLDGPSPDSQSRRPAIAALGQVLGVAYVAIDENYAYRMAFGRVQGL